MILFAISKKIFLENCSTVDFVFKGDDDIFVNPKTLVNSIKEYLTWPGTRSGLHQNQMFGCHKNFPEKITSIDQGCKVV